MEPPDPWKRFAQAPPEPCQPESGPPEEADADQRPPSTRSGLDPRAAYYKLTDTTNPQPEPKLVQDDEEPLQQDDATPIPAVASGEPKTDAALLDMSAVVAELAAVRANLRELAIKTERQAGFVDKLHAENERLQRAETDRLRDPFVRDLVSLADTCLRTARSWEAKDAPESGPVADVLRGVADDVRLILDRQGVEAYIPELGKPFDRRLQRASRTQLTPDAALADTIADVLKPGYRIGERTLRPADVVVWRPYPPTDPVTEVETAARQASDSPDERGDAPADLPAADATRDPGEPAVPTPASDA